MTTARGFRSRLPTFRRIPLPVVVLISLPLLGACGAVNSHGAATDALHGWLTAIENGDEGACDLETDRYHEELVEEIAGDTNQDLTCEERVERMATLRGQDAEPAADSDIEVVELSQGEALMEVTESGRAVKEYWMIFDDGHWLVAGDE